MIFRRRFGAVIAACAVGLSVGGAAIYLFSGGTPPPPPVGVTGNVWVSPSGSDTGSACVWSATPVTAPTAADACLTIDKAASLDPCTGAATARIFDSTAFVTQTITETNTDACSSSTRLIIRPRTNVYTNNEVAGISVDGSKHLEFRYINADAASIGNNCSGGCTSQSVANGGATRVSDDVHFTYGHCGAQFGGCGIFGATNSTFDHEDIKTGGCPYGQDTLVSGAGNCGAANSTPIVQIKTLDCASSGAPGCPARALISDGTGSGFTNDAIFDINKTNTADHLQCIFIGGAQDIAITANKMWDCGGNQGILLTGNGDGLFPSGTIENNYIGTICDSDGAGACGAGNAINYNNDNGTDVLRAPLLIAFNSTADNFVTGNSATPQTFSGTCVITWEDNVISKMVQNNSSCVTTSATIVITNNWLLNPSCSYDKTLGLASDQAYTNWAHATLPAHSDAAPDMSLLPAATTKIGTAGSRCAATDINGKPRLRTGCTVGAWQKS